MILFNETKTINANNDKFDNNKFNPLTNNIQSNQIRKEIKKLNTEQFEEIFKVKTKIAEISCQYYLEEKFIPSLALFTGISYKQISSIDKKLIEKYEYLKTNVNILSSHYGIVNSTDSILPYRLDFKIKVPHIGNLYYYWDTYVNEYIINHMENNHLQQILILSSDEYKKLLNNEIYERYEVYQLHFEEKVHSTFLKKVRGIILNYCIEKEIKDYSQLYGIQFEDFMIKSINKDMQIIIKKI